MRSTELHGERRGWNLHFKRRVVRCGLIFLEVWIFRNVRDQFQNFVADHFSAAPAKRKNGVAHQDHAGARLVMMANFIDSRLLDQLSGSQRAIALIKSFKVGVVQFHDGFILCPSFPPERAREQLGPSMGCVQGSRKLERSGFDKKFCDLIFRQPQAADGHKSSAKLPAPRDDANFKFGIL